MEHKMDLSVKFELPKSPAPTLDGDVLDVENSDNDTDNDDDVEFVCSYVAERQNLIGNWHTPCASTNMLQQAPSLLATPPQSPAGLLQPDMPLLTAMLSNNHPTASPYQPTGYIVHIPCFLCKQPFSDIASLKDHLTMHAAQLSTQINPTPGAATDPHAAPTPPPPPGAIPLDSICERLLMNMDIEHVSAQSSQELSSQMNRGSVIQCPMPAAPSAPVDFLCDLCGRTLKNELQYSLHLRRHHLQILPIGKTKKTALKPFKCLTCKKSYKREQNLVKHIQGRHAHSPTSPDSPPLESPQPAITSQLLVPSSDGDGKKRFVWNTKLLNAVAAANYSPGKESVSKYMQPQDGAYQQVDEFLQQPPKQKYAPRSPFFNPNLWVHYDAYIP